MCSRDDVEFFLNDFKTKMKIWGIVFYGRDKNLQALADLEISGLDRNAILLKLEVEDYSQGPIEDVNNGPSLWVFGCIINRKEVYIKITMGRFGSETICISFHLAEHPMDYPFKN